MKKEKIIKALELSYDTYKMLTQLPKETFINLMLKQIETNPDMAEQLEIFTKNIEMIKKLKEIAKPFGRKVA